MTTNTNFCMGPNLRISPRVGDDLELIVRLLTNLTLPLGLQGRQHDDHRVVLGRVFDQVLELVSFESDEWTAVVEFRHLFDLLRDVVLLRAMTGIARARARLQHSHGQRHHEQQ